MFGVVIVFIYMIAGESINNNKKLRFLFKVVFFSIIAPIALGSMWVLIGVGVFFGDAAQGHSPLPTDTARPMTSTEATGRIAVSLSMIIGLFAIPIAGFIIASWGFVNIYRVYKYRIVKHRDGLFSVCDLTFKTQDRAEHYQCELYSSKFWY